MTALLEQERRDWGRTASLMALLANCNRDSKRKPSPYKPDDFMPDFDGKRKPQPRRAMTNEEMLAAAQRINRMMGGKVVRKKEG